MHYHISKHILVILSVFLLITQTQCVKKKTARLTFEQLQNTDYISEWASGGVASLQNGEFEEKDYVTDAPIRLYVWLDDKVAFGDLDHDGTGDAAVILVTNPGGSGTFFDLGAVINKDGFPENTTIRFLGDRVKIHDMTIKDGIIDIAMTTHGPNDPMCCPTMEVVQSYVLEGDKLELFEP